MTLYLTYGFSYWTAVVGVSLLKLLLINSYRSTDFEVHRNWLAITHSLPLDKWYYEDTSEWTLDYPPFFAYFEWVLSHAAKYFDPEMLVVSNLNYASFKTILFQKLSVIVVDLLLAYAVVKCSRASSELTSSRRGNSSTKVTSQQQQQLETLFVLIFLNGGLFMVDHIHFQYNGFLFGMLLLAIAKCLEKKYYQGAFIFATLLNFKHIFLYMAPAFGVFLLRRQCFPERTSPKISQIIMSVFCFGFAGISVLAASFGPLYNHIPQILSRLFPFQRGLSHAYWAPNVWAPYNTLDWLCNILFQGGKSPVTSGLVGDRPLLFLPQILPLHTFVFTLGFMMPLLVKLWKEPTERNFICGVIATGWTSFMFGYHVHEKAILNVIIPYSLIAVQDPHLYIMTLVSGTVSLFPLLFTPVEIVLKGVIAILHLSLSIQLLPKAKFQTIELVYLSGLVVVYICENLGPVFLPQLPFLPLILVSDYTFIGIAYSYIRFYSDFMFGKDKPTVADRKSKVRNNEDESTSFQPSSPKKSKIRTPPQTPTRVLRKRNK